MDLNKPVDTHWHVEPKEVPDDQKIKVEFTGTDEEIAKHKSRLEEVKDHPVLLRQYLEELRTRQRKAEENLAARNKKAAILQDGLDWTRSVIDTVEQRVIRPEFEWEDVPRLLHQLQHFVVDEMRPLILLKSLAEKHSDVWSSPEATRKAMRNGYDTAAEVWVNSDITKTIIAAAESFPNVYHLAPSDLLFMSGFAVLQDQFTAEDWHNKNMVLSALMWHPYTDKMGQQGIVVWLHAYADHKVKNFPRLYPGWPYFIGYGQDQRIEDPVAKLCVAFLLMIGQPLVAQEHNTITTVRGGRNRNGSKKPKKERSVISLVLRRPKHDPSDKEKDGEGTKVDWQYRWIVNAHWRNQWYPSERRHRTIMIGPFVKGPEDKPLRVSEKVYKWIR